MIAGLSLKSNQVKNPRSLKIEAPLLILWVIKKDKIITVASAGGVVREIQISQAAAEITYEYILEAIV